MSSRLPVIDLTGAVVGTSGTVNLPIPAVQIDELAHMRLYNESGCGLNILFDNGHDETIPAGAWPMFEIEPVVRKFTYTVYYVLPNAPVATVSGVYYYPYEGVPPTPALGNSPIGVTGGVTTTSVQTLSNEGNAANTLVIDMGDVAHPTLYALYTDGHSLWQVDQSGTVHQVLKIQLAGNPLQIGQAGDTSEVLGTLAVDQDLKSNSIRDNTNGNLCIDLSAGTGAVVLSLAGLLTHIQGTLTVDQTTILTGIVTMAAANLLGAAGVLTHILGTLTVDQATTLSGLLTATGQITGAAAQNLDLNAVTGKQVRALINNVEQMHVDGGGLAFTSKKLFDGSANNLADWSAGGLFLKGNPTSQGKFQYQADGSNSDFTISAISRFTGTGNATVAHGLKVAGLGVTPDIVIPVQSVAGSQTFGYSALGSTNVTITTGNGAAWVALAIKL